MESRNVLYLSVANLLEDNNGFIGFTKCLPMTINNEGKKKKLSICGVVMKFECSTMLEDRVISINNVALITKERNGYHSWDMEDYLTTSQISELYDVMRKEVG